MNQTTNICTDCSTYCNACEDGTGYCTDCPDPMVVQDNGTCACNTNEMQVLVNNTCVQVNCSGEVPQYWPHDTALECLECGANC